MKSKTLVFITTLSLASLPVRVLATTPRAIFATSIYNGAGQFYIPTVTPLGNRACYFDDSSIITPSTTTGDELAFLHGVTSSVQNQLDVIISSSIIALTGDVSATGPGSVAATVNSIGGSTAAQVHSAELAANAASSSDTTGNTIVKRNSGNFSAGTITANVVGALTGHASLDVPTSTTVNGHALNANVTVSASDITTGTLPAAQLPNPSASTLGGIESLAASTSKWINQISTLGVPSATQPAFSDISGSVASTQMPALTGDASTVAGFVATTVNSVGGSTAAQVHSAELAANAASSSDTSGNTIVKRNGGNFSAGTITAALVGNADTATRTAITDDTTTNATMYPTWVTTASGNQSQKSSSTKLTFNPSTGMLTSTGFSGPLTGNASTSTAFAADPVGCTNQFTTDINTLGTSACQSVADAYVASNAAIAGTKISPAFGSQNISQTGYHDLTSIAAPSAPAANIARIYSETTQGNTRPVYMDDDGQIITIGRDNFIVAKNTSGSTISKGQAVYITGSTGNIPNISLAKADSTTTLPAIGMAMADIANNAFGNVIGVGILSSLTTNSFTSGDRLWVSPTTAGALTNTRPTYPNYVQRMASVLVSGVGNGSILATTAPHIGNMETGTANAFTSASTLTGTQLISNIATGTAPLTVASTTQVANLNAATAGTATNFSGSLVGDVTGTQGATAITSLADSHLATIATAGKVSNSATTAASANTLSAIVARDGSGNFTAGTITAALTGNATTAGTATNLSGGTVSGTTGVFSSTLDVTNLTTLNSRALIHSTGTVGQLILQPTDAAGMGVTYKNAASSGLYNWYGGAGVAPGNNYFSIMPSTAVDGTTFTTPVFYVSQTGDATVSRDVAVTRNETVGGTLGVTGNLTAGAVLSTSGVQTMTLSNGDSQTMADGKTVCLITVTGSPAAAATFTMPANPVQGQLVLISSTGTITAFAPAANSGQTLSGGGTTLAPAAPQRYLYWGTNWYRM